ncbi:MAG TPA: hypothetical protein VEV17_02735 [Bryobacteraceae bacterium]|nr:hypothetical protein [Bryobacteraceae bacterium]
MAGPTNVLWYSSVAIQFLFCAHLVWTRLAKNHPIFTLYLGCSVLRSLGALHYTLKATGALPVAYTYFWLWTEPILLLLQIGVALEVHAGLWREYGSLVRSARPLLVFALLTAIVFAALPVGAELGRFGTIRVEVILHFEFLVMRYISTVLAIFLALSAALFLVVIRNSLKSSLFRHESMLVAYFAIYAVAYFVVNMGWKQTTFVNNYMLSALTLCLVIWISVFRSGPETSTAQPA